MTYTRDDAENPAPSAPESTRNSSSSSHHPMVVDKNRIPASQQKRSTPLTVFARHKIQRGKEHMFEQWIQEISKIQEDKFPGYGGAEVVRPTCCESNEYVTIFRYENYEKLQAFLTSQERQDVLQKTVEFEEAAIELSYHSLEHWFMGGHEGGGSSSPNAPPPRPPSKPKMVIVSFLLIWVQARYIGRAFAKIPNLPELAAQALTIFVVVLGTTYLWMPITTKYILHWWLFPAPPPTSDKVLAAVDDPTDTPKVVSKDIVSEEDDPEGQGGTSRTVVLKTKSSSFLERREDTIEV